MGKLYSPILSSDISYAILKKRKLSLSNGLRKNTEKGVSIPKNPFTVLEDERVRAYGLERLEDSYHEF